MPRKADGHLQQEPQHGKKPNQKIKPYVVLQYLLRYTDENHVATAFDIVGYLEEAGISAERRSIYRDIEEINRVALMLEEDCTIDEAAEMLEDDEDGELKLVIYDKSRKGFYVRQRKFDLNDIRLLAECVYSAKFVSEGQAKRLVDVVCEFVSEHQAERIRHNAFLTDRVKTNNRSVLNNIAVINEAMSTRIDGQPHTPEKITFKYLKHSISDVSQQVERRQGAKYLVSPFQLLINDGNYYLLAFDDRSKDMRTYRVDRMKDVSFTGDPREGEEAFKEIDLRTYTQRVFSMYGGEQKRVSIRFVNHLLDAVVDRFGTKDVKYTKVDDTHFSISAKVEISDQFFGWLLGFGRKAMLLSPDDVLDAFKAYIDKVRDMY
ncbi:MAG: WYL domain-containing protein [Ruminococcaceae bacterium]|nr:WYL domain-containing protein [Oscillospiraceae bacterium]